MSRFESRVQTRRGVYMPLRSNGELQMTRGGGISRRSDGGRLDAKQIVNRYKIDRRVKADAAAKETVSRVKIPNGAKYGSSFILSALSQQVDNLRPIMPRISGSDFEFFLRDKDSAEAIRSVNRRIKHPATGHRLTIFINTVAAPWAALKQEEKDAIAKVLKTRADQQTRALDLSEFAKDEVFNRGGLLMYLTKSNVFLSVVELIESDYANIRSLSLKGNRIKYLEVASMLPFFAKNLQVLDLSDNQITSISELDKLKGLPLTTLFLENNPVVESYSKASDYLSAVQAIFPRIIMLDGQACSALPGAYDEDQKSVEPSAKASFYGGNDALRCTVDSFIVEYFKHYDGEEPTTSRKHLKDAYDDDNSQFTMCLENLYEEGNGKTRWPNDNFSFHIRLSHNIKQVDKWSKNRQNRLFHGSLDVVAQLCKMPATRHLTDTFIVDVIMATSSLLIFTVQGLFEEAPFAVSPNLPQLNFFSRTFTLTPKANGRVCVISDELYMTAMTQQRVNRYRNQLAKTTASAAPAAIPTATAAAAALPDLTAALTIALPLEADKKAMIDAFCRESGMNPTWAEMCLTEAQWNYQVAGQNFLAAKCAGRLPAEAFP